MDNNDMFQLSLILGAIQILFGMVLKAVNQTIQFGFKYAVATIGWIILLVSLGCFGFAAEACCRWEVRYIWLSCVSPVR